MSGASVTAQLSQHIADALQLAIRERGHALLAVSGGKSPIALFERLREQALDWRAVTVVLVDERCVPHEHADSNTALVRHYLLQGPAAAAHFVPFFEDMPQGELSDAALTALAQTAQQRLAALPWPLDVGILGMGVDGHTASLFPHAPGLEQALSSHNSVAWVRPSTAPHARLTLTLHALRSARELHLSIAGEAKRAVLARAQAGIVADHPVSCVLQAGGAPVHVWTS
ncbi:NagB 6-phosphogluconolactonase/Glucosamine-6-phosphate isomerase/deaminase [Burkholderiaceae bacterium]